MATNSPQGGGRGPQRRRVLEGHAQHGKRFVPPFLEYWGLDTISWMDDILPELLWIALMNSWYGNNRGAELCVELAKAAAACATSGKGAFAFISEYGQLESGEQDCVKNRLRNSGALGQLNHGLQVLGMHYPECPLAFLWSTEAPALEREDGLQQLKQLILELSDRSGTTATFVQATAVYVYFLNDKLKVFSGSALANFPAIEEYPDTEESRKIAAFIRASINGFQGPLDLSADWRRYFWDRGSMLEPCEVMRYDSG